MHRQRGIILAVYRAALIAGVFISLGWGMTHRETPAAAAPIPTVAAQGPLAVAFSRPLEFRG